MSGRSVSKGDLERAVSLLPSPHFRQRDIYDVAVDLGFHRAAGQGLWALLLKKGLIRPTTVRIGRSFRRFYWERTGMGLSDYIVQPADGTTCPRCRRQPRLLIHEDGTITKNLRAPAFYICRCGFIGQVGVGPVKPTDMARQQDYDELLRVFGGMPSDHSSPAAKDVHDRIVRILDGKEPDPRFVPVEP